MKTKPESLQHILQQSDGMLKAIQDKALAYQKLNEALRHVLPAEFLRQVRVGSYERGILNLQVSSQSLAAKLRYLKPEVLSKLRQDTVFCGLSQVAISVVS